jgi:predicted ester cyclase
MRFYTRLGIFVLSCLLLAGLLPVAAQDHAAQDNKQAYIDALAQASSGHPEALYQLYPDTFRGNIGGMTLQDMTRTEVEAYENAWFAAIPDLQIVPDVVIAQNDLVAAAVVYSGTFTEPLNLEMLGPNAVPPTNQLVSWMEIDILRFNADGQIVEQWIGDNPSVVFTEIGIIPVQPADPNAPAEAFLTDPVGFKALSAEEQAATFTSGMEESNLSFLAQGDASTLGADVSAYFTNPYISRGEGSNPIAETTDPNPFVLGFLQAMPDLKLTGSSVLAEGDWIARVVTLTGTFTGEVHLGPRTLNPTGEVITWGAVMINRYNADGKVIETWNVGDATPLLAGLGLVPPTGAPPAN